MKKIFFIPLLTLMIVVTSRRKEVTPTMNAANDEAVLQDENMNQRQSLFSSCADWRITSFKQGIADQTRNFRLEKLTFCPDDTVTLHK